MPELEVFWNDNNVSIRVISLPSVKHKIVFVRRQPKQQRQWPLMSPRWQADSFATTRKLIWFSAARSLLFWSGAHAFHIVSPRTRVDRFTPFGMVKTCQLEHFTLQLFIILLFKHGRGKRQQFCHRRHGILIVTLLQRSPLSNVCFSEFVKKCERLLVN